MQATARKCLTPDEFLAYEESSEIRHEYYQGEIFDMAGGTLNHSRIIGGLYSRIREGLKQKNCEAFVTDMRIWIDAVELFTYPDVFVICGEPELYPNRKDTITNPLLIIEVLSDSTKNYDRGEKFKLYRSLPSLKEYVLIDQYRYGVEQFHVGEDGKWILSDYDQPDHVLRFTSIDFELKLEEIYAQVEFES